MEPRRSERITKGRPPVRYGKWDREETQGIEPQAAEDEQLWQARHLAAARNPLSLFFDGGPRRATVATAHSDGGPPRQAPRAMGQPQLSLRSRSTGVSARRAHLLQVRLEAAEDLARIARQRANLEEAAVRLRVAVAEAQLEEEGDRNEDVSELLDELESVVTASEHLPWELESYDSASIPGSYGSHGAPAAPRIAPLERAAALVMPVPAPRRPRVQRANSPPVPAPRPLRAAQPAAALIRPPVAPRSRDNAQLDREPERRPATTEQLQRQLVQQTQEYAAKERAFQQQIMRAERQVAYLKRCQSPPPPPAQSHRAESQQYQLPSTIAERHDNNDPTIGVEVVEPFWKVNDGASSAKPAVETTGASVMDQLAGSLVGAIQKATERPSNDRDGELRKFMARTTSRELPTFSGNVEEWPTFITLFRSSTAECGFSNQENLARLNKALKGKARECVQSMLALPDNVQQVIRSLEKRFGRPDVIVQSLIDKTRQLGSLKDGDMEMLVDLSNSVCNLVSTMQLMDCDGHMNNPQLRQELVGKLPTNLRLQWGEFVAKMSEAVSLKAFADWLGERADAICLISTPSMSKGKGAAAAGTDKQGRKRPAEAVLSTSQDNGNGQQKKLKCYYCTNSGHAVPDCERFKALTGAQRREWTKEQERCFACFGKGHTGRECRRKVECRTGGCRGKHHPLLHLSAPQEHHDVLTHTHQPRVRANILLRVLPVKLYGPKGVVHTHALLDDGSTVTLIDKSLATQLGASGPRDPLTLRWTDATPQEDQSSERLTLQITGMTPFDEVYDLTAHTANLNLPSHRVDSAKLLPRWEHLKGVKAPSLNCKPKLLIGQDNCHLIVSREVREGPPNSPFASQTRLGWVIHGDAGLVKDRVDDDFTLFAWNGTASDDMLHELVKESFSLEAFGTRPLTRVQHSKEEQRAVDILERSTRRTESGRWETGLLWKTDDVKLPESRSSAMRRLQGIEKKLAKDRTLSRAYSKKITEYVEKGYCRKLTPDEAATITPRTWYLPHFAVTNVNKPGKIRLVFDAAAKSGGVSLNDKLLPGPDLLNSLTGVLCKFREKFVAFGGDIREMFHQVRIRAEDTPSQRFLWRAMERQRTPDTYEMEVMIFGAVSSPCSAQEVNNRNAREFELEMPEAVQAIVEKHYMDDYLDSVDTEQEAVVRVREVISIHDRGGFEMRNWISSSRQVLKTIPPHLRAHGDVCLSNTDMPTERTLGLRWNPNADAFVFSLSCKIQSPEAEDGPLTKRRLLSLLMSVFDPLGFLACFSITARIILQDVWRAGIGWDDELPTSLRQRWKQWYSELREVMEIKIPRCYHSGTTSDCQVELHVFCDASEKAYAAVAYFRTCAPEAVLTALVAARARVAPLKPVSIPRLELQAAVMASRLAQTIVKEHRIVPSRIVFWTDSRTVLWWIRGDAFKFRPFVAHRIGEISETTDTAAWRWVPTKQNVADMATRGAHISELSADSLWFKAPEFLSRDESDWPEEATVRDPSPQGHEEVKREFVGATMTAKTSCLPDPTRFSSFRRLVRTTAWVRRYIRVLMCRVRKCDYSVSKLSVDELDHAEELLCQQSQKESFSEEFGLLEKGHAVKSSSRLVQLSPVLDCGLIRARGRIENAVALHMRTRRPIILDPKHPFTRLLIQHHHVLSGHHGQERVLNELRQRYWVLRMRSAVRQAWSACQQCKNARAKPAPPVMGPLPSCRLTPYARPFTFTGLDYFGPMLVTVKRSHEKRYGALFTCLTTRAVHLELAGSLTTDSAIMAIRRMIARRGKPAEIFSDNGTNFRGADAELRSALEGLDQGQLRDQLASRGITWSFNPPAAPHMGGSWERLVRSVKTALTVLLKERAPKEEVLLTVLMEAEAIVNSRPLTHVSVDANDPESLTPFHFLIGTPGTGAASPPGVFSEDDLILRKQWRVSQRLADQFWKRWLKEYLPTLTRRTKWCRPLADKIKVDDIVIITDPDMPRGTWLKGVVTATYPGRDNVVRVVDVKTVSGTYRRPVSKVAVLDVRQHC